MTQHEAYAIIATSDKAHYVNSRGYRSTRRRARLVSMARADRALADRGFAFNWRAAGPAHQSPQNFSGRIVKLSERVFSVPNRLGSEMRIDPLAASCESTTPMRCELSPGHDGPHYSADHRHSRRDAKDQHDRACEAPKDHDGPCWRDERIYL